MSGSVRLDRVSYQYAGQPLLIRDLSLLVPSGTITVLRCPNGCGKTTLLRLAGGMLRPRRGRRDVTGRVAFIASSVAFHDVLTVEEEMDYLVGAGSIDRDALRAALLRWGFDAPRRGAEISTLSTGWRHRRALALSESVAADCVLLDEPLANLDAEAGALLRDWLARALGDGAAVLVAQHGDLGPVGELPHLVRSMVQGALLDDDAPHDGRHDGGPHDDAGGGPGVGGADVSRSLHDPRGVRVRL